MTTDVRLVDHHAHGILYARPSLDEFRGMFSESPDPRQWPHVSTGLTYRRAMRELAGFFGCESTEDAVHRYRVETDPSDYASKLLRATGTELLLVDDGFPPPGTGDLYRFDSRDHADRAAVVDTLADMFLLARCDALVYNNSLFNQYARVVTGWYGGNHVHVESLFLRTRARRLGSGDWEDWKPVIAKDREMSLVSIPGRRISSLRLEALP